ncbi:AraC family transcriptional regulator [Paracoccus tegillarcae]|uniref:AraC family transcriptional regulator n=1 Tax=Paracoccus tegillarcae TaxID=1529068 RepID=UPI001300A637|nr:AraC family transcriptional regulator [Paracoccus tegillarcae]
MRSELLRKPDERVPFDAICALYEHCAEEWGVPDLGLRLAVYQHLEILGPVALVTKEEPDLRGAIRAMARNLVIHTNGLVAGVHETDGIAALSLNVQLTGTSTRQYMLLSLAVARNVLEQAGKAPVDLIEVTFRDQDACVRRAAEASFGCPVRFGAEQNALYFDQSALDRKIEQTDAAYHAIIDRYLTSSRDEFAGRISDEARGEIARQMEFGDCSLETVAHSLRLEPRSLQRRLQEEGLTFRDLVDDWRRERALSLVTRTRLPLSEVSLALGYADQSVFSRAFQRWYDESPLACRKKDLSLRQNSLGFAG